MNIKSTGRFNKNLAYEMQDILLKRIPPKSYSHHLKDIVNILMNALSRGEIYVPIINSKIDIDLTETGWPKIHLEKLKNSGWADGENSPIVITDKYISWRRWYNEMETILDELKIRSLEQPSYILESNQYKEKYKSTKLNSDQLAAVNNISQHNLILISGGPGTGKTSTIVELLNKSLSIKKDISIGLAAPTGKATKRLEEALKNNCSYQDQSNIKLFSKISCQTIHRWLQYTEDGFSKNNDNQLQLDLFIIDEMSMVDIYLMKGVLNALSRKTQLILIGDVYQLPPIGQGAVWQTLLSNDIAHKFSHCSFHLYKTYRNRGDIALLAKTLRNKDFDEFLFEIKNLPSSSNVNLILGSKDQIPLEVINNIKLFQQKLKPLIEKVREFIEPGKIGLDETRKVILIDKLLDTLEEFLILCPRRYGYWSIEHVHKEILGDKLNQGVYNWPEGTPVICCQNQPELNLSNGDIGIIISNSNYKYLLFRSGSDNNNGKQFIHPARIKRLEPAYALTIHKAQGSESNHVICLCAEQINNENSLFQTNNKKDQSFNKKLIYTAITRAKTKLDFAISFSAQEEN